MRFRFFAFILIVLIVPLTSGCVAVRTHIAERERVDQELPRGAEQRYPDRAKTRQVVVVEVGPKVKLEDDRIEGTKAAPAAGVTEEKIGAGAQSQATVLKDDAPATVPALGADSLPQPDGAAANAVAQYTVQKDDTMQKISKKFLGSYSKWIIIYEANRDVIRDPNVLRPGTVLKIPAVENDGEQ